MIDLIWKTAVANHSVADHPISSTVVHLWRANLCQPSEILQALQQSLAIDEQERVQRFRFEQHRDRAIASRGILRCILAQYLDHKPEQLRFDYTVKGKPFLATSCNSSGLEFNVSHSNDLALYAITQYHPIGVDVEACREIEQLNSILERYFSPPEQTDITTAKPDQQSQLFFQYWTAKEAVAKATGEGLSEITAIAFEQRVSQAQILTTKVSQSEITWQVQSFQPQVNYFAAVAYHPEVKSIFCFDWNESFALMIENN